MDYSHIHLRPISSKFTRKELKLIGGKLCRKKAKKKFAQLSLSFLLRLEISFTGSFEG